MAQYRNLRNLGLGVAAAIPLSLAASQQAHAVPYAYSSQVDTGFAITAVSGGAYTPNAGQFTTTNSISTTGISLPGAPNVTQASGNGFNIADAPQVYGGSGPAPAENNFGQALLTATSPMLRADSRDTGFAGSGGVVAEVNFQNGPAGSTGSGTGTLSSNNTSTITVTVGAGTILNIQFTDTLGAQATTRALSDETASAFFSSSVTIQNQAGQQVFKYQPDGSGNAAQGGTDLLDPFNINSNVAASGAGSNNTSVFQSGLFSANTNPLAAGTYTILIAQTSTANVSVGTPAVVPEPASLALLGAGLLGFGVMRRKRKAD